LTTRIVEIDDPLQCPYNIEGKCTHYKINIADQKMCIRWFSFKKKDVFPDECPLPEK